jgi:hypothetical protein
MSYLEPINQTKLYGLEKYFTELVNFIKMEITQIKSYLVAKKELAKLH